MTVTSEHRDEVSFTAYLTAVARREATQNPRSGFSDPYAARFAERCPPAILRMTMQTAGKSVLAERTLMIDSAVSAIVARENIACVLNLGAGFDSRPYRLRFDRRVAFAEVDIVSLIEEKERLLPCGESPVPLHRFGCDLRDQRAIRAIVQAVSALGPVLVLTEGVLTYLASSGVRELADLLWHEAALKEWVCDVMSTGSAALLQSAAHANGARGLRLHGCQNLQDLEGPGWVCDDYMALKTASSVRFPASSPLPTPASRQIVDGVLRLRRPDSGAGTLA